MDGPYLNSLIPIVGGVAANAWAPMSSVTTPTATTPRLYHASARVSSYHAVHRWSGRTAILLTLPVAYPCVFLLGFGTHSPRVLIHSLLGSALYGAVAAKVLIVRSTRFAPWVLPVAGSLLFSILLGLWLTSALWFFTAAPSAT